MRKSALLIAWGVALSTTLAPGGAFAQVRPGEILVADFDAGSLNKGILFRVDPAGTRRVLTNFSLENTGGQDPRWIAIERNGGVLIVDQTAGTGLWGALIRVDPVTGAATVLSDFGNEQTQGPPGGNPQGVAVEADGHILVMDGGAATGPGTTPRPPRLFRIDPETGERTVLSNFPNSFGTAIAVERSGKILVLDQAGNPRLVRVDAITGNQTLLTVLNQGADPASAPRGIAIESSGAILVAEIATGMNGRGSLFRVNAQTGARVRISDFGDSSQGPLGDNPQQVAVAPNGQIFVTDQFVGTLGDGALFRVDPVSGQRELLSDFGDSSLGFLGLNPFGVAVYPIPAGRLVSIKDVVNNNGGTHAAADWTMTVTGQNPGPVSFAGTSSPGTTVWIDPGAYSVTDVGPDGYGSSASTDCSGTIASGETKTCTITSDDLPATLIVIKAVVNDNGGTRVAADWTMTVAATNASPASFSGATSPGTTVTLNPGPYTVTESGPAGYLNTLSPNCTGTLNAGETKTCTATSEDEPATLLVIKEVVNDNGGNHVAADWTVTVTGTNPSPATFPATTSPGTAVRLDAGAYDVGESGPSGYTTTRSAECTGNIAIGEIKTCTSTSDDQDLTAPDTTITSSPPTTTTSTSATFAFSATEPGTFGCSLDGAAFVTCTSPQTYGALAIGPHTFAVRAIDQAEPPNVDPSPATYSWTVQPVLLTLTVTKSGTGSGTVTSNPTGIDCGGVCAASFAQGTSVTLTAQPNTGSQFSAWSGAADCADGVVTMSTALTCTATFTAVVLPDLTVSSLMIQGPKNITPGSTLQINSTITNATGTAAPSSVSFYLSSNATFEAGDQLLGSRAVPLLAAKATSSATTSVVLPTAMAPGDWFIVAVADVAGAVAETNETNNALSKTFKIKK